MTVAVILVLLAINIALSLILLSGFMQQSQAMLYENGTCTNERLTNSSKHLLNTNGTVGDFLKSLPSDNTIMAQIVCQDSSNETNLK